LGTREIAISKLENGKEIRHDQILARLLEGKELKVIHGLILKYRR
jgi:hypothetical protein